MSEEKTFTQADVDRIVTDRLERDRRNRGVSPEQRFTQADVDRIVSERLARERHNSQAEQEAPAAAPSAAADAPQPSEQATPAAAAQIPTEALDALSSLLQAQQPAPASEQLQALEQRAQQLEQQLVQAQAREILTSRGLPTRLAGMLDYSSSEACLASIDDLEATYKQSVQEGIDARLKKSAIALPRADKTDPIHNDSDYYAQYFGGRRV